jgi:thiamine phosphate synthase YjbQ (UPF0047 family)
VQNGLAHFFVQRTSCSLTITENADPDVRHDLETILGRLAPDGARPTAMTWKGRPTWRLMHAMCLRIRG